MMGPDTNVGGSGGRSHTFRRDIEGLRGLAILLVIAYHAGVPGFAGGFIGVDVFFVLSGYLITGLLIEEIRTNGRLRFANFYARRARRLLPAACAVTIATLLIGRALFPPVDHRDLANSGLTTALYVSNLYFARSAVDYLADPGGNPLLHTWSLAVEEQFYVFWPMIVLLALAGFGGRVRQRRLAVTMVVTAVASYGLCIWLTGATQPYAFFLLPARAWEFAIGALARMAPVPVGTPRIRTNAAAWLGFAAVMYGGMRFGADTVFPGAVSMIPVAGAALMLAAGAIHETAGPLRFMVNRPSLWIGRMSYGWYLWHWPVLIYAREFRALSGVTAAVLLSVLSLGIAALMYRLIENPIRFHPRLVRHSGRSLAFAAAITLLGVGTAAFTRIAGARAAASPGQAVYAEARGLPAVYEDGCHVPPTGTVSGRCEYGDTSGVTTIVLFGDSHAAQWFPALDRVARERHLRLVSMTKSGCPAATVPLQSVDLGREYTECDEWRNASMRRILEIRPAVVVIASYAGYIAVPPAVSRWSTSPASWRAGMLETVGSLVSAGVRVALLTDTPRPGFDVPTCLARAAWRPRLYGDRCRFARSWPARDVSIAIDADVVRATPTASIVDLTAAICDTEVCDPEAGGIVRFRDASHLTTRFADSLAPLLAETILASSR